MKSLDFLKEKGAEFSIVQLKEVPKSAEDVERLYGCPLNQVLKSIVFVGEVGPVIAVVPGDKKVSVQKLCDATGQKSLRIATAKEVIEATGYNIGSVTPFGAQCQSVLDKSVLAKGKVNIGTGQADIGIEMQTLELGRVWQGRIAGIVL